MLKPFRLSAFLLAAATLGMAATACGGGAQASAADASDRLTIAVPPVLGGLSVNYSKKATTKVTEQAQRNSYVRAATVFELRDGKELRGVFEVLRLTPDARPEDPEFRRKIVAQIGGGARSPQQLAGMLVYRVRTNQQLISVWFQDRFMEVLIVRENPAAVGTGSGVDVNRLIIEALSLRPVVAA